MTVSHRSTGHRAPQGLLIAATLLWSAALDTSARAQPEPVAGEATIEAAPASEEPLETPPPAAPMPAAEAPPDDASRDGSEAAAGTRDVSETAAAPLIPKVASARPFGDVFEDEEGRHGSPRTADEYPSFRFSGRLLTGAEYVETHPTEEQFAADSRQPFFLQHARVKVRMQLHERVRASFSANLDSEPGIRSAFVEVELHRAFEIRMGRFKRPMSRIELTSRNDLPFRERGIFNDLVLEDVGWGDRALGVRFSGKFKKPKLRYYVSAMNGSAWVDVRRVERLRGADFIGRLEYRPHDTFRFAVNGGHKLTETRVDGPNVRVSAFGGDAYLHVGEFRWVAESIAAQNTLPPAPPARGDRTPWAMNVISYATYDIDLPKKFELQPLVLVEWVDTDLDVAQDETLRVVAGLNLLWRKWFRLLPQVEVTRPLGSEVTARSQLKSEKYYLMLAVEI